ncbi:rhamnulokinase [Aeoliella sp. SH292]|uniref:rhamnulokinase n=1 Tax=Aeoliella sp. SH292 TaxID=3454464 RepID=UPI003F9DBC00
MPSPHHYIACDLGAESGRVILGTLDGERLALEEVHRFANHAVRIGGSMRWNTIGIYENLLEGLRKIGRRGVAASGVSVDSWGVDYVFIAAGQPMLALPHHYRDPRTEPMLAEALARVGRETIFAETGIQFMALNTLYQLMADTKDSRGVLALAEQFLPTADYMNFLLSGVARCEASLASTTQIYNPVVKDWSVKLIDECELPQAIFPIIVPSGTVLGPLASDIEEHTSLKEVQVIATCSHDTGAAVAAVPAEGDDWAYLSSGTWSLIGVELPEPLLSDGAREENFTNEIGYGNSVRFLKNIIGLWLLQECRRAWERDGESYDYAELTQLAHEAPAFVSVVDPNASQFMHPAHMPTAIADYCRSTGQQAPETPGQFARCIFESLALMYADKLDVIESLTGRTIRKLHIVGGGSQNRLLNQFAADATGRTVLAGPVEATAIGNLLIQAIALGELDDLASLRKVVRQSFPIDTYQPTNADAWAEARRRFASLELTQ